MSSRKKPRGIGRCHQGARPRFALELLRRAAWTYSKQRTARWDRFARPADLPKYGASGFPSIWWWDAQKAAKTGMRQ